MSDPALFWRIATLRYCRRAFAGVSVARKLLQFLKRRLAVIAKVECISFAASTRLILQISVQRLGDPNRPVIMNRGCSPRTTIISGIALSRSAVSERLQ